MSSLTPRLVTIKQCSDPAEAAFFADYLEQSGIHVENSVEKMGAWTGRYSMLSRGPVLRVYPKDAAKARELLKNPPPPVDEDFGLQLEVPEQNWKPGEALHACPTCGSANIVSVPGNLLIGWLFYVLTLGIVKPFGEPMWICRDCDWDSRRAARE